MADYRQDCSDPKCGYDGFTGHDRNCKNRIAAERSAAEREAEKKAKHQAVYDDIDDLDNEGLFQYTELTLDKLAAVRELELFLDNEYRIAREVLIDRGLLTHWVNRKRQ